MSEWRKSVPLNDLARIQRVIGTERTLSITPRAFADAVKIGFDRAGVAETIQIIDRSMFYKSMTTYSDHRVWQDVYHVETRGLVLYVKFQNDAVTEFFAASFKEK